MITIDSIIIIIKRWFMNDDNYFDDSLKIDLMTINTNFL